QNMIINSYIVKRAYDFVGGNIRFKTIVENNSNGLIADISIHLIVKEHFKKDSETKTISTLFPKESKGVDFILTPLACGKSKIHGTVSYFDSKGKHLTVTLRPVLIQIKCPLVEPKEAKLIELLRLKDSLQKGHAEINYTDISQPKAFQLARNIITLLDILEINKDEGQFKVLYSAEAKVTGEPIIIDLNVHSHSFFIDVYAENLKQATGLLAYIKDLLNRALQIKSRISITSTFFNKLSDLYQLCDEMGPKNYIIPLLNDLLPETKTYFSDLSLTNSIEKWMSKIRKKSDKKLDNRTYINLQYNILNWMDELIKFIETTSKIYVDSLVIIQKIIVDILKENELVKLKLKEELSKKRKAYSKKILFSLIITYNKSGIIIFQHNFTNEILNNELIGGFLSAIQSFGSEITKKDTSMRKLEYEQFSIQLEKGKNTMSALITSGYTTTYDIKNLKEFVVTFEEKFKRELKEFNGNVSPFNETETLINQFFEGQKR
ncbi:MAG: hypothetical protein ACFFD2_12250, partial [Promethearchaeota archaeon]